MSTKRLNRSSGGSAWAKNSQGARSNVAGRAMNEEKAANVARQDAFDLAHGFAPLVDEDGPQIGWLLNACNTSRTVDNAERSGVDLYFLAQDGSSFKASVIHAPYFFVGAPPKRLGEALAYCQRTLVATLLSATIVQLEDLDMPNHLSGMKAQYIKLVFHTVSDLVDAKQQLQPIITRNKQQLKTNEAFAAGESLNDMESLTDMREYDVPYLMRVAIDLGIRVGAWYTVQMEQDVAKVSRIMDMVDKAEPVVLAFDIECTKAPLKFPDATHDQIYMISYMVDRQGYLIVNREFVSEDVDDFEYTPTKEYNGPFECFNAPNERALLDRFFAHVNEINPHIFVTYNGDFFDWPFVEARALVHGIDMGREIGISKDRNGEYRGKCAVHMDAFCWVKRDSYLPQGSQGLKAVTKYKLGYDPVEVDPEEMTALAMSDPLKMASYSVSDAVATFYLYDKYVHLFVFSLCTIIPLGSEDVLRKGSGTLCEALLMVEAYEGNIVCPNKQTSTALGTSYQGHIVESETYIGGHVECLESGVFRADLEYQFNVTPAAFDMLIHHIDRDLTFALEVELDVPRHHVTNYNEIRRAIVEGLELLRDKPSRMERPSIYHLDVAAMYPNIILTNRLQPCAMVAPTDCAACVHSTTCMSAQTEQLSCQRPMEWVWRGDYYPATNAEFQSIKTQLSYETVNKIPFHQLPHEKQTSLVQDRLKQYCQTVYKKTKVTTTETRSATVCMRENPFYVNTVRAFRDRRYDYKILTKQWQRKLKEAEAKNDVLGKVEAANKCLVFDSLQLAHKCILNSFYGYVMRKGARWHSMEMAGIVTNTGSNIIQRARQLVEQIGRPLELDTDGIWAILPASFPDTFKFKLQDGSTRSITYPCVMLNADIQEQYTNHQYEEQLDGTYQTRSECSIFFELDGPYKCMVLPASTEEGKLLKKRYAVFNFNNKLTELKGFELKRRGELELIKAFQSQVFASFLDGSTLTECYAAVAQIANRWLDVLDTRGRDMEDDELMALLTENKNMTGKLEDYAGQKSTAITTARRLGEFLGAEMIKDKGLACKLIIVTRPYGEKVTERAVPTAIFAAEPAIKRHFLRKWLRDPSLTDFDVRNLLDWDYYRTRFAGTVQKIISLPAGFQNVPNPVPRIPLPDWMQRRFRELNDTKRQTKLGFTRIPRIKNQPVADVGDIEDMGAAPRVPRGAPVPVVTKKKVVDDPSLDDTAMDDFSEAPPPPVQKAVGRRLCTLCDSRNPAVHLGDAPFGDWLVARKAAWKAKRLARKQLQDPRVGAGRGTVPAKARAAKRVKGTGVEGFVVSTAGSKDDELLWHLVEVQESDEPGLFHVWACTSSTMTGASKLQSFTLKVPKTIYLLGDVGHLDGRFVTRIVPHTTTPQLLLQLELSETQWKTNRKDVLQAMEDASIDAVYESQVSASARALWTIGCVAKVLRKVANATTHLFTLHDLAPKSLSPAAYLQETVDLQRVVVYIGTNTRQQVGMWAIVVLHTDSSVKAASAWLVDRGLADAPLRQKDWQALWAGVDQTSTLPPVKTTVVKGVEDAVAGLNAALAKCRDVPSLVLAHAPAWLHPKKLRQQVRGLDAFPMIVLGDHEAFPALTWRSELPGRLLQRVANVDAQWTDVLECARYAQLPVGNMTGDPAIVMLDAMFARVLTRQQHLLWASSTTVPDLGGKEAPPDDMLQATTESLPVCAAGAYPELTVELAIDGLAIQALLVASDLHHDGGGENGGCAVEELGSCAESFRVLRTLATNLFKDFMATRSDMADHLLQHFYRWVSSPASQLYDPALHKKVKGVMHTLLLNLLAECRRLGATIIYADTSRIVLSTGKTTLDGAQAYVRFISRTLSAHPWYQVMSLTPVQYFSHLLFLDIENLGGMAYAPEATTGVLHSKWNLARYLPHGVDEYFMILVGQFVKRRYEYAQKNLDATYGDLSRSLRVDRMDVFRDEATAAYSQKLITTYFTEKLLRLVPEIMAHTALEFPVLAGSHLAWTHPALELVKCVAHVWGLDAAVGSQVQQLKRALLKTMTISEYADEAKFVNPSQSFVLPDIICTHCNVCRDVDLCREPGLMESNAVEADDGSVGTPWQCPRCHHLYDMAALEMRLVDLVLTQYSRPYQQTDVVCVRCKLPTEGHLRQLCVCSGTLGVAPEVMTQLHKTFKVVRQIAAHQQFPYLIELMDRLME
ncbi:DNA polymerase epsilon catalytic subunit [Achlya hypogyna]|uniref:DNA polymerase epsilon catalytic subunit n=1 Tax=Achlya hypogyna TaxID=1202772 RepID=A0A1V9ZLR1_ACHHY|nr:DNA polymerase epsilon catalytic subunit [Achlya hypogyna]